MISVLKQTSYLVLVLSLISIGQTKVAGSPLNQYGAGYYYDIGKICYKQKKYDCAIQNYSKAIDLTPNDSKIYNSRGLAYHFNKNYQNAITDFDRAIELRPSNYRAYTNRGNANRRLGRYEQAITDISKSISINPRNMKAYHNRASVYIKMKKYHEAESDLNVAMNLGSRHHMTFSNRGYVSYKLKKYEQAITDLSKGIELSPTNVQSHNALAWIYATVDDVKYQNGDKAVFHAFKSCELTGWKKTGYIDTLAAAYARTGDFQKAIYWQKKVISDKSFPKTKIKAAKMRLELYRSGRPYVER